MAQQFRTLAVYAGDPDSIPSTNMTVYDLGNSNPGEAEVLFKLLWAQHVPGTQTYIQVRHSYTKNQSKCVLSKEEKGNVQSESCECPLMAETWLPQVIAGRTCLTGIVHLHLCLPVDGIKRR